MKVLILTTWGGSFDFGTRSIAKYTRRLGHVCDRKHFSELSGEDTGNYDVVFLIGQGLWEQLPEKERLLASKRTRFVTTHRTAVPVSWNRTSIRNTLERFDGVGYLSPEKWGIAMHLYPEHAHKMYYVPNGVDHEVFAAKAGYGEPFKVGWAGCYNKGRAYGFGVKRFQLLKAIAPNVEIKDDIFPGIKAPSQNRMKEWYHTVSVFLHTSDNREGGPNVLFEAASCGLPVIATRTDDARRLFQPECLLPLDGESEIIKLGRRKLRKLRRDPTLRESVGRRNRHATVREFCFEKTVGWYYLPFFQGRNPSAPKNLNTAWSNMEGNKNA